jgi:hypothetical protein
VTERGFLESVTIEFAGAEMRYSERGAILPTYPELQEEVYRVANFVADRLFSQTAYDAIDPGEVFLNAPTTTPENEEEENEFKAKRRSIRVPRKIRWATHGLFEPAAYGHGYTHSAAHGYFADAQRATSVFQQFELLFKVVEYFFPEHGPALDAAVSTHIAPYDATYTLTEIEKLRLLRNRSIHPRAEKGHVNPKNIAHVGEVHTALPRMHQLANLLLANPTF